MNLQHHFLIAMPSLQDPIFHRSVIYLCEHNAEGAMGLVINKPAGNFTIKDLLKKLAINQHSLIPDSGIEQSVMLGGPLAEDRGFILHTPKQGFASSLLISDDTMITTSKDVLDVLGTAHQPQDVLVTLGYAGWEAGQLEQEIMDNSWLTVEADTDIIFNTPISQRWQQATQKLGIHVHQMVAEVGHA